LVSWVVVPIYLHGQFPAALSREILMGKYGKNPREIDECHVTVAVLDVARRRFERFDPYSHDGDAAALGDPALCFAGGSRYDIDGPDGLDNVLASQCREACGADWEYFSSGHLCGEGAIGPQDLEDCCHVEFTRPTDGLGFCAAWGFFLAECRILNPGVDGSALIRAVVETLGKSSTAAGKESVGKIGRARVLEAGRSYAWGLITHRNEQLRAVLAEQDAPPSRARTGAHSGAGGDPLNGF